MTGRLLGMVVSMATILSLGGYGVFQAVQPDPGPADVPLGYGWAYTVPVGKTFGDGFTTFRINGDQPAAIDSVELVDAEGMRLVGFMIADRTRGIGSVQYIDKWPPLNDEDLPSSSIKPGVGAKVPPKPWDVELLLGIKVTREGYLHRKGIQVDYSVGDEQYSVFIPGELSICTSGKYEVDGSCPLPFQRDS